MRASDERVVPLNISNATQAWPEEARPLASDTATRPCVLAGGAGPAFIVCHSRVATDEHRAETSEPRGIPSSERE